MFATPVVYPLSIIPEQYVFFSILNPMTSVVESFKFIFFGESAIQLTHIIISILISTFVFLLGLIIFYKTEKTFIDTV